MARAIRGDALGGYGALHGWLNGHVLASLGGVGAVIALAVAAWPPLRRFGLRLWRMAVIWAGVPRRRYARWFIRLWGAYENPYLDDMDDLDLLNTYVPLHFRSADGSQETRTLATEVLAREAAGSLVICGGPGSGKSTLLKAYGVRALQERSARVGPPVVPFFVQFRQLSRFLAHEQGKGLAGYLVEQILVVGVGMTVGQAAEFLAYSLSRRQVVVMLDGLDEVMNDHYQAVREAVFEFAADQNPNRPTYRARIFISCRQQNFLSMREDWIPAFSTREYSLAPLQDSEILSYLDKYRKLFKSASGSDKFMQALRASGSFQMQRTPLILAMSIGLYSHRDYYEIPSSAAELCRIMIREMLDGHGFRRDAGGALLKFRVADKLSFLCKFALVTATGPNGFGDFALSELVAVARGMLPELKRPWDPREFVQEIIINSGLLFETSDTGEYVYAHRIIHEYLVAEELSRRTHGDDILLERTADPEWRNVFFLYVALVNGANRRDVNTRFVEALAQRSITLAAGCLGFASVDPYVATWIVEQMARAVRARDDLGGSLAALNSAANSPSSAVRALAAQSLLRALDSFLAAGEVGIRIANSANAGSMVQMLHGQLASRTDQSIGAALEVLAFVPNGPSLAGILWQWLSVPGVEHFTITQAVVTRLLGLAHDEHFRGALDELRPVERDPAETNYQVLIRWADRLQVGHQPRDLGDAFAD